MAVYLGMEKAALMVLVVPVARELSQLKSALPTNKDRVILVDHLPPEIKTLPLQLLGDILRIVYFLFTEEGGALRTMLVCVDPNDKFCLKSRTTAIPIHPFSVSELIKHGKIKLARGLMTPSAQVPKVMVWNLNGLHVGDVNGVAQLPIGERGIGTLSLSANVITQLPDNFLAGAIDLEKLEIARNLLRQLPPNFLSANRRLLFLVLAENQLQSLPENFMVDCRQLRFLDLRGNQLRQLPENFLSVCPHLQSLHLENNFLSPGTVEQIRARLIAQGKVIDGVQIVLEPQQIELDKPVPKPE